MSEEKDMRMESAEKKIPKFRYSLKYIIFLVVILGLAHILDEYSTYTPSLILSSIVQEFFLNQGISETQGLQIMSALTIVLIPLALFGLYFKGLQDKFGRKIIFINSATIIALTFSSSI